ncbi:hypothetical protein HMPREF1991_02864 [Hoylesella loescheii DSM 19665 = JCM 12249 = ATCC 15930]|uniref:Uncharacterized protein n=1 Tax=Hoylesella loescheii DSM 19665 = JCM 12249 = ATCC 15930 TaxID=1122985 RepID=A0A069QEH0_HOYLO|nr:hypothetical protein HMPREF1991_02864 [Hoylesella loescheii DSM 19665 = JCM 12249 = ATCC 15930]
MITLILPLGKLTTRPISTFASGGGRAKDTHVYLLIYDLFYSTRAFV